MIEEKIIDVFTATYHRNTRPRKRIAKHLAALADSNTQFTIDGLWHDLRQQEPHLGRATIYRSVELLVAKGLLGRIDFADGTHCYHVCGEDKHSHLTCIQCHRFIEVHVTLPIDQMTEISSQTDFVIENLSLTLFGFCSICRT